MLSAEPPIALRREDRDVARTQSTMLALGSPAPDFSLTDTEGRRVSLVDFRDRPGLLVTFLCNHWPFVRHVESELARRCREFERQGLGVVAINSNDVSRHPDDGVEGMREQRRRAGFEFPYLLDETQEVARAYRAACTPEFYLFDGDRRLFYRGQMDDSRPESGIPVTGSDLTGAVEALLAGRPAPRDQRPSIGCNIKWRPDNEPEYFPR
jgi:peroxiredoxin